MILLKKSQQQQVDTIVSNVEASNQKINDAYFTLKSIRKSPLTYAVAGGIGATVLGGPVLWIALGMKVAIGGSLGLSAIGAFSGKHYASKSNESIEKIENKMINTNDNTNINNNDKINNNNNNVNNNEKNNNKEDCILDGAENEPLMFEDMVKKLKKNKNNKHDNDDDIEPWDARN